jgi:hypothetical protein
MVIVGQDKDVRAASRMPSMFDVPSDYGALWTNSS